MAYQSRCALARVRHPHSRNTPRDFWLKELQTGASTLLHHQKTVAEVIKGVNTRASRTLGDVSRHRIDTLLPGLSSPATRASLSESSVSFAPAYAQLGDSAANMTIDSVARGCPDEADCLRSLQRLPSPLPGHRIILGGCCHFMTSS